jgi:hypothetical protein
MPALLLSFCLVMGDKSGSRGNARAPAWFNAVEELVMANEPHWRLSVKLRDGRTAHTATIDFRVLSTLAMQVRQLKQRPTEDWTQLFEFTNELGDLLAFRASTYQSFAITPL